MHDLKGPGQRPRGAPGHLTRMEHEENLARVAALHRKGYTHKEIAKMVGLSYPVIFYYIKKLIRRYVKDADGDISAFLGEKLAQYREVRRTAWEGWEQSGQPRKREVFVKTGAPDKDGKVKPGRLEARTITEERAKDNSYLRIIMDCLMAECRLLGLMDREDEKAQKANIDWDSLVIAMHAAQTGPERKAVHETVEDRLQKMIEATIPRSDGGGQQHPPPTPQEMAAGAFGGLPQEPEE